MIQKDDCVLIQDYFHCICIERQKNANEFFKFENEIVKPIMDHIKNNGEIKIWKID